MTTPARKYQDVLAEMDAYEPSVIAEAMRVAQALARELHSPALALMADTIEETN